VLGIVFLIGVNVAFAMSGIGPAMARRLAEL
jgi:hypothetical protein